MCGIFGYTGRPIDASGLVFEGLRALEYRGYDSWGIAVGANKAVRTVRDTGKLGNAPGGMPLSGLALGHTRWATTGAVTMSNAHPHRDCTGRLALVHNGIIENYEALRADLRARGHRFVSETDTEVAAHLLEEELAQIEQSGIRVEEPLAEALRRTALQLHGLNALAAIDASTGEIVATKNGSPLIIGLGSHASYLASDQAALLTHTDRLVFLRDGQTASLSPGGVALYDSATGAKLPLNVEQVRWRPEQAGLNGYRHFLEKEIWEQPELLRSIARSGLDQAEGLARFIGEANRLYLTGCGTAYHAALSGVLLLASMAHKPAQAVYPHEFGTYAPLLSPGDAVLAFSQSGETIDVLDATRAAATRGAAVGALVNVPGSTLTREADFNLMLGAGPEKSVLSTKTFMSKLAYMYLTAGVLAGDPATSAAALVDAANDIEALKAGSDGRLHTIETVGRHIADRDHLFVLGRGLGYPMALEAALKIKEVSYIHAEGFASGELKHGVIALIEPGTPVIVFVPEGEDEAHMLTAAGEVRARGAYIIGIGPENHSVFDVHLPVCAPGDAFYPAATAVAQRIAYELALVRGTDPDRPRNLAKSVTVR
jgi:glutamine---fructose-6-phosphate transaminase (isomerizing)